MKKYQGVNIAITGSFGKTSVKNVITTILESKGLSSPKSYNTPMGLTKFYLNEAFLNYEFLIMEFGATRKGDIKELMNIFKPSVGILTGVGYMHLDTFKTLENIITEKMHVIDMLPPGGIAVVNFENEILRGLKYPDSINLVTYGINYGTYQARNIIIEDEMCADIYYKNNYLFTITTRLKGENELLNILCGIAFYRQFYHDDKMLVKLINFIKVVDNRKLISQNGDSIIINDAFNANKSGFIEGLNLLSTMKGKKILITPGLVEVSKKENVFYLEIVNKIIMTTDVVILVGYKQTKNIYKYLDNATIDVYLVETFEKAYYVYKYIASCEPTALLIENDIPDYYRVGFNW